MKQFLCFFLSTLAFSWLGFSFSYASSNSSTSMETSNKITSVAPTYKNEVSADKHIYFSTNFIELSKGSGNFGADFIFSEKFAATIQYKTNSNKEKVKKNDETKEVTVDRTSYSIGMSYYPVGLSQKLNYIISPRLAFGTKKDLFDVESQVGMSLKISAVGILKNNLSGEFGIRADNLEDGTFIGEPYLGFGYLF